MGKRTGIILAILVVACAVGIFWPALHHREPVYKAKPLSEWLHGYDFLSSRTPGSGQRDVRAADEAIKAAGTNAIPTLLRLLEQRDSKLERLWAFLKARIGITNNQTSVSVRNNVGVEVQSGFHALGSNGADAVPGLLEIYQRNPDPGVKMIAVSSLQQIGPTARAATPVLIKIATQPDTNGFMVRYQACYALLNVNTDPGLSVPVFIKCLKDRDGPVREAAATCLGFLGTNARPAIPALIELVTKGYRYPQAQTSAQIALGKIDPAAATNAGVSVLIPVEQK